MTDELKPVRCGCGGEAFAGEVRFWGRCYTVQCSECGIETKPHPTEAEAVQAWNRAMGMSEDETVTNCNALKPERSRTFLEIVVSYPAFCTYPEYEGKPYYAIKFEENGETIVGFGTYKPEVLSQYLQEYFITSAEPERTAKVETVEKPNVFKCSECGQYFHSTAWGSPVEYCSRCGAKLDWNEDIPMEYFESGGR